MKKQWLIIIVIVVGLMGARLGVNPRWTSLFGGLVMLAVALRVLADTVKCRRASPVPWGLRHLAVPLLLISGLVLIGVNGLLLSVGFSLYSALTLGIGVVCLGACALVNMKISRALHRMKSVQTDKDTS